MPDFYVTTNILEDNNTGKTYAYGEKVPNLPKEKIDLLLAKGRISKTKPKDVPQVEEDEVYNPGVLAKAPPENPKEE